MRHNKSALLSIIREALNSGEISEQDLASVVKYQQKSNEHSSVLSQFLYYLGGIIILVGLLILIHNFWATFNATNRILIAAGAPLVAYLAAIILAEDYRLSTVATPFFLLFSLLVPIAFSVSFYEAGAIFQSFNTSILSAFSLVACFWAFRCYRRTDLLVFVIFYASVFYFSLLKYWSALENSSWSEEYHLLAGFFLALVYLFILRPAWMSRPGLAKALLRIGMLMIFFVLLLLREPQMHWHVLWDLFMPICLFLNFMLSFRLQDKILMVLGWLVFVLYVFAFTSDYFAHSLGWPFSLVIMGLLVVALTFFLKMKRSKA